MPLSNVPSAPAGAVTGVGGALAVLALEGTSSHVAAVAVMTSHLQQRLRVDPDIRLAGREECG